MSVVDTSALVSLASIDLLDALCTEFDVHTTGRVVDELEETAAYDDDHGVAVDAVLDSLDRVAVHQIENPVEPSRIDPGEGSCAQLTTEVGAAFLITNDLGALPELQPVADASVAISPIVLRALVERDVLEQGEARDLLADLAAQRDWLGAPIFRRAERLFDFDT